MRRRASSELKAMCGVITTFALRFSSGICIRGRTPLE
jgi:hypothetical protein